MLFKRSIRDLLSAERGNLLGFAYALGPGIAGDDLLRTRGGLPDAGSLGAGADTLAPGDGGRYSPEDRDRGRLEIHGAVLGCRLSFPVKRCLKEGPGSMARNEVGRRG